MATQSSAKSSQNGSAGKNSDVTIDDLKEDFDQLRGDMSSLVEQMKELSKGKASEAVDNAKDKAASAASDAKKKAGENLEQGHAWFADQARNRPLVTVGALLAAGFLVGRMMRN